MNSFATTQPQKIRRRLLGTASAIALLVLISEQTIAGDASKPQLWIAIGGGFDQMDNAQAAFDRPFAAPPRSFQDFTVTSLEKPSQSALNLDGKITFQPEDTDWMVSAEVRFGRSSRGQHRQSQPNEPCYYFSQYKLSFCSPVYAFADATAKNSESHEVIDFKAGKDVGLGSMGSSVFSAGLRYAQFKSAMSVQMASQPTNYHYTIHRFEASMTATRKFSGIGPSVSWDASVPIAGNSDAGLIALDWGVNAALLFGRQKANAHHETKAGHRYRANYQSYTNDYDRTASPVRSKAVSVPNLGGFAGLSVRYASAKISLGYRADMFFNAVDVGIDTRKTENRDFYGPFASISIGFGN
jgi:iron complex outermembrane receptor protein